MPNIRCPKTVLLLLFASMLLPSCVIQQIDHTPYEQTDYFRQTLEQLEAHAPVVTSTDTLQVGWAKVNITPPLHTPLAGYGKRRGMKYTSVHDSAYVRTFSFGNGSSQAYFVALDMLITPMAVSAALEKEYARLGLKPEQVYLSATHTHTSFGGWGKKLMGRIMAGRYKEQVVQATVQHIVASMALAQAGQLPARIGYGQVHAAELVGNRLTGDATALDTTLRYLKFEQKGGGTALLCSFSAHPTILPSRQPILSRDYPGALVDSLESVVDFAAFSAGAVASHRPHTLHGDSFESTAALGNSLARKILNSLPNTGTSYHSRLGYASVPLQLPEPQWRSGDRHRFGPGLFHTFFGNYPAYLSSLQLGNVVLLGVPADYSGEFLKTLTAQAKSQGQELLVTGFNAGYIGYVTPDEHYGLKNYETRAMNFYGPQSGSYLTAMLLRLLQRHQPEAADNPANP
ncbi:neutral/alkaline non-lysosomal ceramidase N-terminal domain-containing protein [Pontibacter beigongshangensis]|uniref:neutral/alkaline non-lysosomal ceramidase N-terminal domain-containing protein n=1 Tax=Pontibacter beigongshangensis TaxID=2574733 RepID=UPI00164EDDD5|nr:neutral/alkaline non-lysosomal ceramidase N-terminal domain-containing protein [Pontibacter beigongshangensis]